MKKILAMLLALTMVLALAACGAPEEAAPAATEAPQTQAPAEAEEPAAEQPQKKDFGGATVTVAMWGDNARKDMFEPVLEPFEKEYNVNVEIEVYSNSEYATKVLTEVSGGHGPDVAWLTERYYPMFADVGVLADVNPLMEDPEYKYDDFSASLMSNYIVDGKLMAVPFTANPLAFFYNATMFREAGLETPLELYEKGEWTIDKMLECARTLTDSSTDTYGLSLVQTVDPTNWPPLLNFIWANGADMFTPDTSKCIINDEAGIAALQLYQDLMFKDKCCVVPGQMATFESGQLAMYPGNPSEGANYQNVNFDWDYICYPANNQGELINVVGVAMYAVLNSTENYDASVEVVKFLTSEEVQTQLAGTFTPTRESLKASDTFLNVTPEMPSPRGREILYLDVFAGTTRTYPATTNWNEVNEVGKQIFDMLYTGNVSAEEVAAKFDSEINAMLK